MFLVLALCTACFYNLLKSFLSPISTLIVLLMTLNVIMALLFEKFANPWSNLCLKVVQEINALLI